MTQTRIKWHMGRDYLAHATRQSDNNLQVHQFTSRLTDLMISSHQMENQALLVVEKVKH